MYEREIDVGKEENIQQDKERKKDIENSLRNGTIEEVKEQVTQLEQVDHALHQITTRKNLLLNFAKFEESFRAQ